MCTLTYEATNTGFCVRFNRDEHINRPVAIAPSSNTDVLMPIDPKRGGTWIAANAHGLVFCLLNNYQVKRSHSNQPKVAPETKSRGEIIKHIQHSKNKDTLLDALKGVDPKLYPGFQLVVLGGEFTALSIQPRLTESTPAPIKKGRSEPRLDSTYDIRAITRWPITSSSYSAEVIRQRETHFLQGGYTNLDAFHASHFPDKGAYSVCVHRTNVETVSYTKVHVSKSPVKMDYFSGSPCEARDPVSAEINRLAS